MTFAANETSTQAGRPVELYEFSVGSAFFRYTSAHDSQLVNLNTYTPTGIERSGISDGAGSSAQEFEVTLPVDDPLARLFTGTFPGITIGLVVSKFHRDDLPTPEVVQIFEGVVEGAGFRDDATKVAIKSRPELSVRSGTIPKRKYQGPCNHVLYDPTTCTADDTDPALRASAISVVSQMGTTLNVSGLSGTFTDGWFVGGYVESLSASPEFHLVLAHTGNTLELLLPFRDVPTSVNVLAGCDRSIGVCDTKFNRRAKFGGHFAVPTKNIFRTGL